MFLKFLVLTLVDREIDKMASINGKCSVVSFVCFFLFSLGFLVEVVVGEITCLSEVDT